MLCEGRIENIVWNFSRNNLKHIMYGDFDAKIECVENDSVKKTLIRYNNILHLNIFL